MSPFGPHIRQEIVVGTNKNTTQENAARINATVVTHALTQQLSEYRRLREEERLLRLRVQILEEREARSGPMRMDVDEVISLRDAQAKLEKIRGELGVLEKQLEEQESVPSEQRTEIEIDRLVQLVGDIKARREQLVIYQANVRYLEELQPKLGIAPGLDFINELNLIRKRLSEVQSQIEGLEQELKNTWNVEWGTIAKLPHMDDTEIRELAGQLVVENLERDTDYGMSSLSLQLEYLNQADRRYHAVPRIFIAGPPIAMEQPVSRAAPAPAQETARLQGLSPQALQHRRAAQQQYDGIVKNALMELVRSIYPDCRYEQWKICSEAEKSKVEVSVALVFDGDNQPVHFACCVYEGASPAAANSLDLSRKGLIGALRSLLGENRKKRQSKWKPLPKDWQL